jgi:MFS family permease
MYRDPEDEIIVSTRPIPERPSVAPLIPIMAVVLIAFLIIGLALPVLPLHVHQGLGFGAFIVGVVTGSQFDASLLSRVWAGYYADRRGPKCAVIIGLLTAVTAGVLYILSLRFTDEPPVSVIILMLGRALLGSAESFIITGAVSWGLALVGARNARRAIAWVGMAMFAALALGAPLGAALYSAGGFCAVAIAATLMPLVTVLLVARFSPVPPQHDGRPPLKMVAIAVWLPGFGSALSSIGFGSIIAFGSLLAA